MPINSYLPDGRPKEAFYKRALRGVRKVTVYGLGATMAYHLILNASTGNPYMGAMLYGQSCMSGTNLSGKPVGSVGQTLGCYNFIVGLAVAGATERFFDRPPTVQQLQQAPRVAPPVRKDKDYMYNI